MWENYSAVPLKESKATVSGFDSFQFFSPVNLGKFNHDLIFYKLH